MRKILLAGLVLGLSACGGGEKSAEEANMMGADNMALDQNMTMDQNMTLDQNGSMNGMMNMDGNATMDANTHNMMMKDATTNDPDTNLANGV
jgi:hypothetical protein